MVRASGELDLASAKMLEEELRRTMAVRRITASDASPIVLDLGKVDFIDSAGLGVLLWAAEHSREDRNRLRIREGSAAVRKIFEVKGVQGMLPLTE